jgi:hypothetical protein
MADFTIRAGTTLPPIEGELTRGKNIADITGASVARLIYKPESGGADITRVATIVSVKPARAQYGWISADTLTPGIYLAYWEIEYSGGAKESFPSRGRFKFAVTEQ